MPYPGATTFPGALFPGTTTTVPGTTVGLPRYIFRTPYIQRRVPVIPPVMALMNFSVAVLRINGEWVETDFPSEEQINAADLYFPGGYENEVDAAIAQILQAAGYDVATVIDDTPPVVPAGAGRVDAAIVGLAIAG